MDRVERRLARGLGWFSIGLGLAQIVAPRHVAQWIGAPDHGRSRTLVRVVGMREMAAGAGLLTRPRPAGWVWARVAGDLMDLALLGSALTSHRAKQDRVAAATAAVVGITITDLICAIRLRRRPETTARRGKAEHELRVKKAITVRRPPEDAYRFWRDFENLPRFMNYLESVQVTGDRRSHWKVQAPAGKTVEWDAEIIEDRPNELIAWRSLEGADVANSGEVRFRPAPGGRGTEIQVELSYDQPGGKIGQTLAKLFGHEPGQQVGGDLRRFKQALETGEVIRSEATIQGVGLPQRPAQPPEAPAL